MREDVIWTEKYRPRKIADTILPKTTKTAFQQFVDERNVPNLLLSGSPGTGKTTAAMAVLEELDCDYIMINASLEGGIDTLRGKISNFASSVSFSGGRKYIILDESDYLTAAAQAGLRNSIETYANNCGFIFTCNYRNRIIDALQSRLALINFTIDKSERPELAAQFFKSLRHILDTESVTYDKKALVKVIEKHFPDFRKILNELQYYSKSGTIDEGILKNFNEESIEQLFGLLKDKKFIEIRKWCAENSDQDTNEMFRRIYDISKDKIALASMPGFVVTMADYMYKNTMVADTEINMVAFLTEIMLECDFL